MAHLDEGIRDPIRCFEYMGRFYVQEGNKRVSVLKYFEAGSVTGNVIRMVPQYNGGPPEVPVLRVHALLSLTQTYLLTLPSPAAMAACKKASARALMKSGPMRTASRSCPCTTGSRRRFDRLGRRQAARHGGGRTAAASAPVLDGRADQIQPQRAAAKNRRPVGRRAGPAER